MDHITQETGCRIATTNQQQAFLGCRTTALPAPPLEIPVLLHRPLSHRTGADSQICWEGQGQGWSSGGFAHMEMYLSGHGCLLTKFVPHVTDGEAYEPPHVPVPARSKNGGI